jgi:hypothetical protein
MLKPRSQDTDTIDEEEQMEIDGVAAIVSGGASGLGAACARQLAVPAPESAIRPEHSIVKVDRSIWTAVSGSSVST